MTHGSAGDVTARLLLCGGLVGVAGLLSFGTIHALAIVPIWGRLAAGFPFALAAGLAAGWAYHEYRRSASPAPTMAAGVRFGALTWLVGLPATALANAVRLLTPHRPLSGWVDGASLGLAACGGALLLWRLTHTRRGALAGAVALPVLLTAGGGPVPVANGGRAIGLWAGFLVVYAVGGAVLAVVYARVVAPALPVPPPAADLPASRPGHPA
jgi:hypothetical protein